MELANVRLSEYIKNDKVGKYYMVDSDKIISKDFNGLTRLETYETLVNIRALNEDTAHKIGVDNFLDYVNKVLDGGLCIGRFRFYRVSNFTQSLSDQMRFERMRYIKEEY